MHTAALNQESKKHYCRRKLWSETRGLERGGGGGGGGGEVIEGASGRRQSELMTISETAARYSPGTNHIGSVFLVKTLYTL